MTANAKSSTRQMGEGLPAVILLGHGSRVEKAGSDMERVAAILKDRHGFPMVEYCFMSRLPPHFPETLSGLVARGATRVLVIPYFLHTGLHIRLDIPEMMQHEAVKYPGLRLQLGGNLGYDDILVDLVRKRIDESLGVADIRAVALPGRETFPVPPGQAEFVPMDPAEAKKYRSCKGRDHDHGHQHH
jgi:sirohydrochlorin ferrochelatase